KPIAGKEDQAGGVIWRLQDANNYYIARANGLENNVAIYHAIKGKRTEKKRTNMKVVLGQWHTLRVDFNGSHFTVMFDGKKTIEFARLRASVHRRESFTSLNWIASLLRMTKVGFSKSTMENRSSRLVN